MAVEPPTTVSLGKNFFENLKSLKFDVRLQKQTALVGTRLVFAAEDNWVPNTWFVWKKVRYKNTICVAGKY